MHEGISTQKNALQFQSSITMSSTTMNNSSTTNFKNANNNNININGKANHYIKKFNNNDKNDDNNDYDTMDPKVRKIIDKIPAFDIEDIGTRVEPTDPQIKNIMVT